MPVHTPPLMWRGSDFLVAFGGGLAGAAVAVLAALAVQANPVPAGVVGQYTGHLLALRWMLRRRGATLRDLGLDVEPSDTVYLAIGMALQLALALLFLPLAQALEIEDGSQAISDQISSIQGLGDRAAMLLGLCLLGPLAEELMFRGLLLRMFEQRRSAGAALLGTSAVFALFHVLGISPSDPVRAAAIVVPQIFLVGLILGRQAQRRGRLGVSIFTHAGFNLLGALVLLGVTQP